MIKSVPEDSLKNAGIGDRQFPGPGVRLGVGLPAVGAAKPAQTVAMLSKATAHHFTVRAGPEGHRLGLRDGYRKRNKRENGWRKRSVERIPEHKRFPAASRAKETQN